MQNSGGLTKCIMVYVKVVNCIMATLLLLLLLLSTIVPKLNFFYENSFLALRHFPVLR